MQKKHYMQAVAITHIKARNYMLQKYSEIIRQPKKTQHYDVPNNAYDQPVPKIEIKEDNKESTPSLNEQNIPKTTIAHNL